jgi:hypothetical protein
LNHRSLTQESLQVEVRQAFMGGALLVTQGDGEVGGYPTLGR